MANGRNNTALTTLNIALVAPMPSASVSTATTAKPGLLRRIRCPWRKSCQHVSTKDSQPAERTTSFVTSRFPRSKRTARSASLRLIPCFIFSSAAISKKPFSSSSNSWSTCSFRNSDRSPLAMFRSKDMVRLRRLQDSGDRRHLPSPFSCFAVEPLLSLVCQGVILCAPAILGGFPFASDQPRSLQPLKGHKQRTRIEAENALAHLFEPDGDPRSVHGCERRRDENEHVGSAWSASTRLVRHRRIPPEDQEEEYAAPTDCQEDNRHSLHALRDNSTGDGRSLRYGLSAPPTASQAFVPGVEWPWKHHTCSNDGNVGERTTTQSYST